MNFRIRIALLMLCVPVFGCADDRVPLDPSPIGGEGQTSGQIGGSGTGMTGGMPSAGPTGGKPGGIAGGSGGGGADGTWKRPGINITITPEFLDFGQVAVGGQILRSLTIRNTGSVPITELNLYLGVDGSRFIVMGGCSLPLAPGASCTVPVVFAPSVPGAANTTLTVSSSVGSVVIKMSGSADGTPEVDHGMIGHWKFDERSGPIVNDSTGNANHGSVRKGATSDAPLHPAPIREPGWKGGALRIEGRDDWVNVPDSDSLDRTGITNQVSISAWIKLDRYRELRPFDTVAQRHMLGTRLEQFFMGLSNGKPAVGINFFYGIGVTNVPLKQWVHLAMTYDGIQQCGYVNGVESVCQDVGWPIATDDTPFTMGAGINEQDVIENITGLIDEVRLYNVQLSPEEISDLYRAQ